MRDTIENIRLVTQKKFVLLLLGCHRQGCLTKIGIGGSKGISLMSADMANKYAIVYKGKELLVEPTDLRHATVSAAYDCTYKEFDSYEEAQAYVDAHGLEYRKSE